MPDLVVAAEGETESLRLILKAELVTARQWHLRLFENNYIPDRDVNLDVLSEVTFPGYLAHEIDPTLWTDPVQSAGLSLSYYGPEPVSWQQTAGSPMDCWGFYVTFIDAGSVLRLLYAERFDTLQVSSVSVPVFAWPVVSMRSKSEPVPPPP